MKNILKNQLIRLFRLYGKHPSRRLCRMIYTKYTEAYPVIILVLMSLCASAQTDSLTVYEVSGVMAISAPLNTEENFTHVIMTDTHFILLRTNTQPNVGRIIYRDTVANIMRVRLSEKYISVQITSIPAITNFRIYSDGKPEPDFLLISDRKRKY